MTTSAKGKPRFRVGQVVFVKNDSYEYERIKRIGPTRDLGTMEIRCFNPRWGGDEIHQVEDLRPLTAREIGPRQKRKGGRR